jgi:hypothetical protein
VFIVEPRVSQYKAKTLTTIPHGSKSQILLFFTSQFVKQIAYTFTDFQRLYIKKMEIPNTMIFQSKGLRQCNDMNDSVSNFKNFSVMVHTTPSNTAINT